MFIYIYNIRANASTFMHRLRNFAGLNKFFKKKRRVKLRIENLKNAKTHEHKKKRINSRYHLIRL